MNKYYPPVYKETKFHCLRCNVYAQQSWETLFWSDCGNMLSGLPAEDRNKLVKDLWEFPLSNLSRGFESSQCSHCSEHCFWYKGRMVVPSEAHAEPPHQDLPQACLLE